jgi:hypothetical protein
MFRNNKGSTLIVVILVSAFLLAVGVAVLTVTSTGPAVSGNMRDQEMAFNAAEAGFDASRMAIESLISSGTWANFSDHYLDQPTGFDIPFIGGVENPVYFRRHTDEEVLAMIAPYSTNADKVIFYNQPFVQNASGADDLRYTYTAFLINDEAGGGTIDPADVLLVCIGVVRAGTKVLATARLEIVLESQTVGTNP